MSYGMRHGMPYLNIESVPTLKTAWISDVPPLYVAVSNLTRPRIHFILAIITARQLTKLAAC